jgi:hypothetical protein
MRFPEPPPAAHESAEVSLLSRDVEACYGRERYQLYKARTYSPRATNLARLRELERAWQLAEQRLRRARSRRDGRP